VVVVTATPERKADEIDLLSAVIRDDDLVVAQDNVLIGTVEALTADAVTTAQALVAGGETLLSDDFGGGVDEILWGSGALGL
jgi:hypothetical protein